MESGSPPLSNGATHAAFLRQADGVPNARRPSSFDDRHYNDLVGSSVGIILEKACSSVYWLFWMFHKIEDRRLGDNDDAEEQADRDHEPRIHRQFTQGVHPPPP